MQNYGKLKILSSEKEVIGVLMGIFHGIGGVGIGYFSWRGELTVIAS